MRTLACLLLCALAAPAARAGGNDLQLWRLGHPNAITVCTACDGSSGDAVVEPGDPAAQARFARLASTLGLALAPAWGEQARTTGQAGFEVGFASSQAFVKLAPDEWPSDGTRGTGAAPSLLVVPTVSARKGLGGSFELGLAVSHLADSNAVALSGEVRWAAVEGLRAPDVTLRAWGTRLLGARELDLFAAGADATISTSFGLAGMVRLQPWAQGGVAVVNATSGVVDFRPQSEDSGRPGANPLGDDEVFNTVGALDNRYLRAGAGVRLVAGVAVIGVEGGVAFGRNPVQKDALAGGAAPEQQYTRVWTLAGRVGLAF